jgi:hypothetical protein
VIFLLFMTGFFLLQESFTVASILGVLLFCVLWWTWFIDKKFKPLSKFVSLSSVFEVERGEEGEEVVRLRAGHPVTWSQSNLSRRRYAQNDDTLYVAPEDERTDYVSVLRTILHDLTGSIVATSNGKLVQWCSQVGFVPVYT